MAPRTSAASDAPGEQLELVVRRSPSSALGTPAAPPPPPAMSHTAGLLLFAASTLFSTLMASQAKLLTDSGIPVFEAVFARSAFLLACSAAAVWQGRVQPVLGHNRQLLLLRGLLGFLSVSSIYAAVSMLPLGEATVLSFLAPLWVAMLSQALLSERPSTWYLASIPVCLLGVVLLAQPKWVMGVLHALDEAIEDDDDVDFEERPTSQGVVGSDAVAPSANGTVAALGVGGAGGKALGIVVGISQALFSAGAKMSVRALRTTDDDRIIMLYMGVVSTLASGLACVAVPSQRWRAPRTPLLGLLLVFGVGLAGLGNQVCFTVGMRHAPSATSAMSLSYLSIVWAFALGLLVFHETPLPTEWVGTLLIVASTLGAAYMDHRGRKKKERKQERGEAHAVDAAGAGAGGALDAVGQQLAVLKDEAGADLGDTVPLLAGVAGDVVGRSDGEGGTPTSAAPAAAAPVEPRDVTLSPCAAGGRSGNLATLTQPISRAASSH